jgi:hypothetical protein
MATTVVTSTVMMASSNAAKVTVNSAKAKMKFLNALNTLHKTKMFGRNRSEPLFKVFRKHPITRGMASYLVIWPTGNLIQQTLCKDKDEKYDIWKMVRFGFYGCFITAPTLFAWVRLSTFMYPNTTFRIAMAKVRFATIPIVF